MKRITAYRDLGTVDFTCNMGHVHTEHVYAQKFLYDTGETHTEDWWGYNRPETSPIWIDSQGNRYLSRGPLDFYGGVTYIPENTSLYSLTSHQPKGLRWDEFTKTSEQSSKIPA